MKVALHACCCPCLLEPLDDLLQVADRLVVVFANPNIHPADEYRRRREALFMFAESSGVEVVESEYDPDEWLATAGSHARDREARCAACYRLRLTRVARWAADNGFDAIATTLTVSPYQDIESISAEGSDAAAAAGLAYLQRDYRERYPEATRRSREAGMYRQNYCGCVMSEIEAAEERAARRAARRASRAG